MPRCNPEFLRIPYIGMPCCMLGNVVPPAATASCVVQAKAPVDFGIPDLHKKHKRDGYAALGKNGFVESHKVKGSRQRHLKNSRQRDT